jgi:hypothetical protein
VPPRGITATNVAQAYAVRIDSFDNAIKNHVGKGKHISQPPDANGSGAFLDKELAPWLKHIPVAGLLVLITVGTGGNLSHYLPLAKLIHLFQNPLLLPDALHLSLPAIILQTLFLVATKL